MSSPANLPGSLRPRLSAWQVVWWFGFVSLAADMVYEGARSMYGPVLAALGASGVIVGLVTGAGEAMSLVLRLFFGPVADRTGRYWTLTIVGYGLTAVCVPLLWFAPRLGTAGLGFAVVMILLERLGKAVRSPSKSALLAHAAGAVGRGRGFGVHKALDQVGAFSGPLLVAAVVAVASIWAGLAVLVIPGVIAMLLLAVLCWRVPDPSIYDESAPPAKAEPQRTWLGDAFGAGLPPVFFRYALACSLTTGALVTFGLIGYHLSVDGLVPVAAVPIVYAGAMGVEAVAALIVGGIYDRMGAKVLLIVPVLVAIVPAFALGGSIALVLFGVAVWGFANGVQDSTIKAAVADLVPAHRRATAYGVFAGIQGMLAIGGGAGAGWLYDRSLPALVAAVIVSQLVAAALLLSTLRSTREPVRR